MLRTYFTKSTACNWTVCDITMMHKYYTMLKSYYSTNNRQPVQALESNPETVPNNTRRLTRGIPERLPEEHHSSAAPRLWLAGFQRGLDKTPNKFQCANLTRAYVRPTPCQDRKGL